MTIRQFTFGLRLSGLLALLYPAHADAQVVGAGLGYTSSNVEWVYDDKGSVTGNTSRRTMSLAGSYAQPLREHLWGETGLRIVGKGFNVTGPRFHIIYLEAPVLAVLQPSGFGPFLGLGTTLGLRVNCQRYILSPFEVHTDTCGDSAFSGETLAGLRRWDLGGELDLGLRIPVPEEGWYVFTVRFQRSLVDLQPKAPGRMRNLAVNVSAVLQWEP